MKKGTKEIKGLAMVYGLTYCAKKEVYSNVSEIVESGIDSIVNKLLEIEGIEIDEETNELGKVKKIDPLNITSLRIRGMYLLQNPFKLYGIGFPKANKVEVQRFVLFALIPMEKYNSFCNRYEFEEYIKGIQGVEFVDCEVDDPTYRDRKIACKKIVYKEIEKK